MLYTLLLQCAGADVQLNILAHLCQQLLVVAGQAPLLVCIRVQDGLHRHTSVSAESRFTEHTVTQQPFGCYTATAAQAAMEVGGESGEHVGNPGICQPCCSEGGLQVMVMLMIAVCVSHTPAPVATLPTDCTTALHKQMVTPVVVAGKRLTFIKSSSSSNTMSSSPVKKRRNLLRTLPEDIFLLWPAESYNKRILQLSNN